MKTKKQKYLTIKTIELESKTGTAYVIEACRYNYVCKVNKYDGTYTLTYSLSKAMIFSEYYDAYDFRAEFVLPNFEEAKIVPVQLKIKETKE